MSCNHDYLLNVLDYQTPSLVLLVILGSETSVIDSVGPK
jgi:hypothetical protein